MLSGGTRMLKKRTYKTILVFSVGFVFSMTGFATQDDLKKTTVSPHMEMPIQSGQNLVYCSTFQIAWNKLKVDIIKGDIKVQKPVAIVPLLNKSLSTESDLSEEDYLALAGFAGDNIVGRINASIERKFNDDTWLLDAAEYSDSAIISYSYLKKELKFEHPFEDFRGPITFYSRDGREEVEAFGISKYGSKPEHQNLRNQVELLDYSGRNNFIIRLNALSSTDEIILAQIPPGRTLLDTIKNVESRISSSKSTYLQKDDVLQIPKLDLSLTHSYSSLLGVYLANKGFEDYFFDEATQRLDFRLDESGARVKSDAIIVLKRGPVPEFKLLVFNRPFLLYIKKQNGEYPYLAMWIENTELLVKSKSHDRSGQHSE
jgi:hypothetical protein